MTSIDSEEIIISYSASSNIQQEYKLLEESREETLKELNHLKSLILSESYKFSKFNCTIDFSESIKLLECSEKLLKYKKYHSQLVLLKSIIHDFSVVDTLDIKEALLLYKDASQRLNLDLNEFSLEIREFIQKSTKSLKFEAQK